jgi:hypothetical protein
MERDVQRVAPICTKEQSIWRTLGNRHRAMFRAGTLEEKSNDRDWISQTAGKRSRLEVQAQTTPSKDLHRQGLQWV